MSQTDRRLYLLISIILTILMAGCGVPTSKDAVEEVPAPTEAEFSAFDAIQEGLSQSVDGENSGPASGNNIPDSEPTVRIDIDTAPEEVANPDKAYSPDMSGEQQELSAIERSAEEAGIASYTGVVCRITIDGACSCSEDQAASEVTFTSANEGTWSLMLATGSSVTFNIDRLGLNTWQGATTNEDRTISMELVFFDGGFQQTTTIDINDKQQVTCTNLWERQ